MPPEKTTSNSQKPSATSDLQGLNRLVVDATLGITDLVETVQRQIVHPPFLPATPIQHWITMIAGLVYKNIKWSTRFFGSALDKVFLVLNPEFETLGTTNKKELLRSILNGLIGDYLEDNANPLAITMQFKHQGKPLPLAPQSIEEQYPAINGKMLVLVHGLCMNDQLWTRKSHDHGAALAKALGMTPIYLQYNTGRHISSNGRGFNTLLEALVLNWPVPVEELVIVGHSMGGLVTRSALYYGQQAQHTWPKQLKKLVFLGTPHHGASLERTGNYIDTILQAIYYTKPFARLGKIRSAGITDLRYGAIIDEDWQGKDRFEPTGDPRQVVPLPASTTCYSIAGVLSNAEDTLSSQLIGDGLVDLKSALGQHKSPAKNLNFKAENTYIAYETNHLDLLSAPQVYAQLKTWLEASNT